MKNLKKTSLKTLLKMLKKIVSSPDVAIRESLESKLPELPSVILLIILKLRVIKR